MVGVLSFGRGLFNREPIENGRTSYKFFYRLKAEHVVMSQLFGWEGALALSSEEFSGKFLSPQFPTFICDPTKLDRKFLGWLMRRPVFWEDLGSRTSGMGDRRRTLTPEALFASIIPLPPLSEQQKIVVRIEKLATKLDEAVCLHQQVFSGTDSLLISMAQRNDLDETTKRKLGWTEVFLSEVITQVQDKQLVSPNGIYPNLGIYSFGRGLFEKPAINGFLTSALSLYRVHSGQFIYSRLFAFEGAYGIVPDRFNGYFVSSEYPTFTCNTKLIKPEFLLAYFKSHDVWKQVAVGSKGLGDRRQRVQPQQLLNHRLMVPPLEWQVKIHDVLFKVNVMQPIHKETTTRLSSVLPSILEGAFNGPISEGAV
jgi:type I restriction enzyme S subunit